MLNMNEEQLRKWLKDNFPFEELSEVELKRRFIESFGEDKWNEMEALKPADDLMLRLCNYLNIEPVPVLFEEMYEDSRYYDKLDYIAINKEFMNNKLEIRKSIIHEVKHLHQKHCISHKNDKNKFAPINLVNEWEKDFNINQRLVPLDEQMLMPVEIDAFAFTKFILKKWFHYDYHHYDLIYDEILNQYCNKYFN